MTSLNCDENEVWCKILGLNISCTTNFVFTPAGPLCSNAHEDLTGMSAQWIRNCSEYSEPMMTDWDVLGGLTWNRRTLTSSGLQFEVAMTQGGAAQVAAAPAPERSNPAVYTAAITDLPSLCPFTHGGRHGRYLESMTSNQKLDAYLLEEQSCQISSQSGLKR